jgi:methylamine dehydrogenase accessory protein MauD
MVWMLTLARLFLISVFVIAAFSKFRDRPGFRGALRDFGLPPWTERPLVIALPIAELSVAGLLIADKTAKWGAGAALVFLAMFIGVIARSLVRGEKPNCHCFGQLHSSPVGWATLARNGGLAAIAGLVFWRGGEYPAIVTPGVTGGYDVVTWIALGLALAAFSMASIQAWLLLNVLPQQGRFLMRLEKVEAAMGMGPGDGLTVGTQAPDFELPSISGERVSLALLLLRRRPIVLFFTNPDCEPCDAMLPTIARWQREQSEKVTLTLIARGTLDRNREKATRHALAPVLVQREREVAEVYKVDSTPAAVLIDADGRIASRIAYGAEPITALLRQAIDGAAVNVGLGVEPTPADPVALRIGESVPPLVLPKLDSKTIDLRDELRGTPTLVLFWRPDCVFCQRMLPELRAWERRPARTAPRLLLVSTGTVDANRSLGLVSPIVLDTDGYAARSFGASGTPMGLLVDAGGRIASSLATGAQAVMALARKQHMEPAGV